MRVELRALCALLRAPSPVGVGRDGLGCWNDHVVPIMGVGGVGGVVCDWDRDSGGCEDRVCALE